MAYRDGFRGGGGNYAASGNLAVFECNNCKNIKIYV